MEQTAQYDHIGSKYDEYAQTATLKRAESYTFFAWWVSSQASASWTWPAASASTPGCSSSRAPLRSWASIFPRWCAWRAPRSRTIPRAEYRGRRHPPARARPLRSGHSGLSAQLCDEQGPDAGMCRAPTPTWWRAGVSWPTRSIQPSPSASPTARSMGSPCSARRSRKIGTYATPSLSPIRPPLPVLPVEPGHA